MELKALLKRMKAMIWSALVKRLPENCQVSYSQFGEDMILSWLFRHRGGHPGFFVDVGAYHPITFSNTFALYTKGWRGINVEPRPGAIEEFRLYRPRDINLRMCVTPTPRSDAVLYQFEEAIHNTIDEEDAQKSIAEGRKLIGKETIPAATINEILSKYLPPDTAIDLFSIDVEGVDEAILHSVDWERFTPLVLIFESRGHTYPGVLDLAVVKTLDRIGYDVVAKCGESIVMRHRVQWRESLKRHQPPTAST